MLVLEGNNISQLSSLIKHNGHDDDSSCLMRVGRMVCWALRREDVGWLGLENEKR